MSRAEPYDDLIMDHIRNARNHRVLDHADLKSTGSNPLCGDEVTVYLRIERSRIEDIAFQCSCCGISMASASIMTDLIKGRDAGESRNLLRGFMALLDGRAEPGWGAFPREQQAIYKTARKFPARRGCAALPWATLEAALNGRQEAVMVR